MTRKRNEDRPEKSQSYNGVCGSMLPWEAIVLLCSRKHLGIGRMGILAEMLLCLSKKHDKYGYIFLVKSERSWTKRPRGWCWYATQRDAKSIDYLSANMYVKFDETSVVGNIMKIDDRPSENELLAAEAIVPDDDVIGAVSPCRFNEYQCQG